MHRGLGQNHQETYLRGRPDEPYFLIVVYVRLKFGWGAKGMYFIQLCI